MSGPPGPPPAGPRECGARSTPAQHCKHPGLPQARGAARPSGAHLGVKDVKLAHAQAGVVQDPLADVAVLVCRAAAAGGHRASKGYRPAAGLQGCMPRLCLGSPASPWRSGRAPCLPEAAAARAPPLTAVHMAT